MKFYKGALMSEFESERFLTKPTPKNGLDEPDDYNQKMSIRQQIIDVLKKFQSPQAKKAFFISFSLLILTGGSWIFPGKTFSITLESILSIF